MEFVIYKDSVWEFRWRVKSTINGRIIWASSEWFHTSDYCKKNAKLVRDCLNKYNLD